jgi:hypothetical protein
MPNPVIAPERPLIIVCGHSIYLGGDPYDEESWLLKPFQQSDKKRGKVGEHITIIAHINRAFENADRSQKNGVPATIAFSGGFTQDVTPPKSEAESYAHVFRILHSETSINVIVEDLATDSFQNVLFSILKYQQLHGHWPDYIYVVTHQFKARRFMDLHLKALKWPRGAAAVDGIDPEFSRSF